MLSDSKQHLGDLLNDNAVRFLEYKDENQVGCFVVYGNDQIFVDEFVYTFLCHSKFTIYEKETHRYSDHHFEFDFSNEHYIDHIKTIKDMQRMKTINNKAHVVYIKHLPLSRCKYLHHLIDCAKGNMLIIISVSSLQNIDQCIRSRSIFINTYFPKAKCLNFIRNKLKLPVDDSRFDDIYAENYGNLISCIYRIENGEDVAIKKHLLTTLDIMQKSKSMLVIITTIREFIYKIYHVNIPFNWIAHQIILHYSTSPLITDIIECCAAKDHMLNLSYKEIFIYEKFFLEILAIIKNPAAKPKKTNTKTPEHITEQINELFTQPTVDTPLKKGRKKAQPTTQQPPHTLHPLGETEAEPVTEPKPVKRGRKPKVT